MLLTNFVFISVIFFHCFGLPWLPTVGGHFWPFTDVLRKILRFVTRKVQKSCRPACADATAWQATGYADVTDKGRYRRRS